LKLIIFIDFTNFISEEFLKKLALIDELQQIKGVHEFYLDYNIINSNLFHLGIESSISMFFLLRYFLFFQYLNKLKICEIKIGKNMKPTYLIESAMELFRFVYPIG